MDLMGQRMVVRGNLEYMYSRFVSKVLLLSSKSEFEELLNELAILDDAVFESVRTNPVVMGPFVLECQELAKKVDELHKFFSGPEVFVGTLPKRTVSSFDGDISKFQSFWLDFKISIDSQKIPDGLKLLYLKDCCKKNAFDLIQYFNSYEDAKKVLCQNFENEDQYKLLVIKDLQSMIPVASTRNVVGLKTLVISFNGLMQRASSMKMLNEVFTLQILDKLLSLLPNELSVKFRLKKRSLPQVLDDMQNYVLAMEQDLLFNLNKTPTVQRLEPQRRIAVPMKCRLCDGSHWASKCSSLSPAEAKRVALSKKLCFICFGKHYARMCTKDGYCCRARCRERHAQVLCPVGSIGCLNSSEVGGRTSDGRASGGIAAIESVRVVSEALAADVGINELTQDGDPHSVITMPILVDNKPVSAMYDTGATVCAISERLCKRLNVSVNYEPVVCREVESQTRALGFANVLLLIGSLAYRFNLLVLANPGHEFIIGVNAIDLFRLEQRIGGKIVQVLKQNRIIHLNAFSGAVSKISDEPKKIVLPSMDECDLLVPDPVPSELFCSQDLRAVVQKFNFMFEGIGKNDEISHEIICDARPIRVPNRIFPVAFLEEARKQIKDLEKLGIVERSKSDWASALVPIRKKDGSLRLAVDYRALNNVSKKDAYPIPRIDELMFRMSGSLVFTTLDLTKGYYQILMDPGSREKTAFKFDNKLYHFVRMPFGLSTAPQTFQRLMNRTLDGLSFASCYLDDVVIFSRSVDEHKLHLKSVLNRLVESGLRLNKNKCCFGKEQVTYLGYTINKHGMSPLLEKINVIAKFPKPSNAKELTSFLGMVNFYRSLIPQYAAITALLYQMTSKNAKFVWTEETIARFERLKKLMLEKPVVRMPCVDKHFFVRTDASKFAMGAVLLQIFDGIKLPVEFASQSFDVTQSNYATIEQEATAIMFALERWKHFLFGNKFTIETDHKPLQWLMSKRDCSGKLGRMALRLQEFLEFEVTYIKGSENQFADALSRISIGLLDMPELDFSTRVLNQIRKNPGAFVVQDGRNFLKDGMRLCLDNNSKIRLILKELHDNSGHLGYYKVSEAIRQRFYWPGWQADVRRYLKRCSKCAFLKDDVEPSKLKFVPHASYDFGDFERIAIDLCGPFSARGNTRFVVVVQDLRTKWLETKVLRSSLTREIVEWLQDEVFSRFGFPKSILCDQGSQFESREFKSFCVASEIEIVYSSPYHHTTNGQVERAIQTKLSDIIIIKMIRTSSADLQSWDLCVSKCTASYNVSVHCVTGMSPFQAMFKRPARLPLDSEYRLQSKTMNEEEVNSRLSLSLKEAAEKTSLKPISCRSEGVVTGDLVLWHVQRKIPGISKKLTAKWQGPFKVVATDNPNLILQDANRVLKSVHRNHVKKFFDLKQLAVFRSRGRPLLERASSRNN